MNSGQTLQQWREAHVADECHPVVALLAQRVACLMEELAAWGQQGPTSPDWWVALPQMSEILTELMELTPWLPLLPGVSEKKREQKKQLDRSLRDSDVTYEFGKGVMEQFSRSGAPTSARVRAVHAFEMQLRGAQWTDIREKLCPYRHTHQKRCADAIRREVFRLKQLLRKYNLMPN